MSKGEKIFWFIVAAMIIAVNPPVINWISNYAEENLLTIGFPTLWLWMEFWYALTAIAFFIAALKIDKWRRWESIEINESSFED